MVFCINNGINLCVYCHRSTEEKKLMEREYARMPKQGVCLSVPDLMSHDTRKVTFKLKYPAMTVQSA